MGLDIISKTDNWFIIDDNGVIHSGSQEDIQLIWDLTTRSIEDVSQEYRSTYSKDELIEKHNELLLINYVGSIHLIERHLSLSIY